MTEATILSGNANLLSQGSWVQKDQGTADKDGFRNVSQYWLPKTLTFEQGFAQIADFKRHRKDVNFDIKNVQFGQNTEGKLTVDIDGQKLIPTDWAGAQLCKWFNTPTTMWNWYSGGDVSDVGVLVNALRNGQGKYDEDGKEMLFRTYDDGTLRAIMSNSYSIVDNEWYLKVLEEYIPGGRLSHFNFADGDNFYGNVLIPDTIRSESDSEYGGMLSCSNSEIGKRTIGQRPAIFRAICMNGCIWGEEKGVMMKKRHRGVELNDLKEMIRKNIETQIPLLTTKTGDFIKLHDLKANVNLANVFAQIAKANSLNSDVMTGTFQKWQEFSNEKTAFGVVDALTRAGQLFDADTWNQCDIIAGSILNNGAQGWDKLQSQAKLLTDVEVAKLFGVAV